MTLLRLTLVPDKSKYVIFDLLTKEIELICVNVNPQLPKPNSFKLSRLANASLNTVNLLLFKNTDSSKVKLRTLVISVMLLLLKS